MIPPAFILSRKDLVSLMAPADYLEAVEAAFRADKLGRAAAPLPMHIDGEGVGAFHAKGAAFFDDHAYAALKFNGNFPNNPEDNGLPTIQGAVLLCDARNGSLLAILDSIEVTLRRTAAASAVAAKYLARKESRILTICGCGEQARAHVDALSSLFDFDVIYAWDIDLEKAMRFADEVENRHNISAKPVKYHGESLRQSDIVVTCTSANEPFLTLEDAPSGVFIAAVGADNPNKNEIAPALMASATVVCDVISQCAEMGDLRAAIEAGAMSKEDIYADFGDVVTGRKPGRRNQQEIIVFDSTGTALQDVTSAAKAYERALETGAGRKVALGAFMTDSLEKLSFAQLTWQSFKIGCLGFGGPAGQIALMHRLYVDRLKWIDEERYLHALNFCMLLPGPEAQQLAVYVGWLTRGVVGGLIAGVLFVLPGAIFIFALSWLYVAYTDVPAVIGAFYGVKAAVLAIVADALIKIGKRALKTSVDMWAAAAAFLALFFAGVPFPLVILLAACLGAVNALGGKSGAANNAQNDMSAPSPLRAGMTAAVAWGALWLTPVVAASVFLGGDHVISRVGFLFSQLALVTFGGAYAVLAYLQQQAVEVQGWLSAGQMIDGLGLAETTPGPLVLVNQYVGFLAGWTVEGGFWMALACAAMASWCTFAPSFLWIFAGAPLAEHLRRNRYAAGALRAITAAVLGVVASLAVWFAVHVVFAGTRAVETPWGHVLQAPVLADFDPAAAGLALAAGVALIPLRANMITVIAFCVAGGQFLR